MSPPRSKFGPEVRAKILARIEIGVSYTDAATAAGVKPATAKSWLGKGRREKKGAYAEFAKAVESARKTAEDRPAAMSTQEFRGEVEQAIRGGSVQAMKLWGDLFLEPDPEPEEAAPSKIAELAEHRRRKARR